MDFENTKECVYKSWAYKGWTIIDNGYGFQGYGPHGERLGARCCIDELIETIDEREG